MSSTEMPQADLPPLPEPTPAAGRTPGPPGGPRRPPGVAKNPWAAAALSFAFPGLGQVYNGQVQKGFVFFAAFVGSIWATAEISGMPFAFGIAFSFLFGVVDAFRSAALLTARAAGGDPLPEELVAESPAWGITLIALGALFLLHNFGWLNLVALSRWWPILLIAAGAWFVRDSLKRGAK